MGRHTASPRQVTDAETCVQHTHMHTHTLPPAASELGAADGRLPGQPRAPAFADNHLHAPGTRVGGHAKQPGFA